MSAALDVPPVVHIPERARPARDGQPVRRPTRRTLPARQRPVACLHVVDTAPEAVPAVAQAPVPLRLTRRGLAVVGALVGLVCAALVATAWASAPAAVHSPPVPASVTVRAGDTLWSIATRIEPNADPRAVVDSLMADNHLSAVSLVPGQVLRTR